MIPDRCTKERPNARIKLDQELQDMAENTKKSSAAMILAAWLVVCIPLAWGVYNTVLSSLKLFAAVPSGHY
jgi:hypothetical protein